MADFPATTNVSSATSYTGNGRSEHFLTVFSINPPPHFKTKCALMHFCVSLEIKKPWRWHCRSYFGLKEFILKTANYKSKRVKSLFYFWSCDFVDLHTQNYVVQHKIIFLGLIYHY